MIAHDVQVRPLCRGNFSSVDVVNVGFYRGKTNKYMEKFCKKPKKSINGNEKNCVEGEKITEPRLKVVTKY